MTLFRNFTLPEWEIFGGNLLLLLCSIFYLAWWAAAFKPGSDSGSSGGIFIGLAFIFGIAALALMSHSISSLFEYSKGVSIKFILTGSAALFVIVLVITITVFHRVLTSELIIIHIWAALELCAIAALYGAGRFGTGRAVLLAALTGIAFAAGIICYVLYYRLDQAAAYLDSMVPIAIDTFVAAVFALVLAVS